MKAGIIFSDRLVTVSPTYAREIISAENGFGLDGLLTKHSSKLTGILNGVDYSLWDPASIPSSHTAIRHNRCREEEEQAGAFHRARNRG